MYAQRNLRFPCSGCVHLLCVPLLCVPALCVFVRRVVCLCSARPHRAALVDVVDTTSLVDPGDLTCPFPILSPIALLLLAHMHVPAMLH